MMIGQDLDFDVPRTFDIFLQVYAGVTKRRFGFGLSLHQGRLENQIVSGHAHALTPAARGRFDQARGSRSRGRS